MEQLGQADMDHAQRQVSAEFASLQEICKAKFFDFGVCLYVKIKDLIFVSSIEFMNDFYVVCFHM